MPQDPPPSYVPSQTASGNTGSFVQVGRDNNAPIYFSRRPKLSTSLVPGRDLTDATNPVWASTPTPEGAAHNLRDHGIAVIAGEHGTGRRISAIRALQTYLAARREDSQLFDVAADWADDEVLDEEILPDPVPGHGYLIDAISRPLSSDEINRLTSWADKLRSAGSCVAITVDQRGWQGDSRFFISAERPSATQVTRNHLAERLRLPQHASWLCPDPDRTAARGGLLRSQTTPDPTAGVFSDLITNSVSPSHAVEIAERIRDIDPKRVTQAVALRDDRDPRKQEKGNEELKRIQDEVLLWTDFLEKVLTEPGTRGQDRIMLLSAAYLEHAPVELCIKAAAEFGDGQQTARRYREGRSPRRRLRDVGVDPTPDDKVAFERHPGLAIPAILMDWHHWTDEREATKIWVRDITATGCVAAGWAKQVGERLLQMSREAVDPPFFDVVDHWINAAGVDDQRIRIIAELLTEAARTELARETDKRLLAWAQRGSRSQRQAAAQVCAGLYGRRRPNMALVRLRHIFGTDDDAAKIAANALTRAAQTNSGLNLIVETVISWLEKHPAHPGGPRAFLALIDPSEDTQLLSRLLTIAQGSPKIRDFLIDGWQATLQRTDVQEQAYQVLLGWAQAVHEGRLNREFTFGVLTEVRNEHTPLDAMSRFLYGNRDEDPVLVDARLTLANLPSLHTCSHASCPQSDCPTKDPSDAAAMSSGSSQGDGSDPRYSDPGQGQDSAADR